MDKLVLLTWVKEFAVSGFIRFSWSLFYHESQSLFFPWVEKNQYPNEENWGKWIQSVCLCLISLYQLWIVTISLWISFRSGVGIRGNCVMPWNPNIRHGVSIVLKMYIPGLKILYRTTTLWAENASRNLNTYALSGWDCPTAKQNVPQ